MLEKENYSSKRVQNNQYLFAENSNKFQQKHSYQLIKRLAVLRFSETFRKKFTVNYLTSTQILNPVNPFQ